jgi:hypothetical protein
MMDMLLEHLASLGLAGCQHATLEETRNYARSLLANMEPFIINEMRREDA